MDLLDCVVIKSGPAFLLDQFITQGQQGVRRGRKSLKIVFNGFNTALSPRPINEIPLPNPPNAVAKSSHWLPEDAFAAFNILLFLASASSPADASRALPLDPASKS